MKNVFPFPSWRNLKLTFIIEKMLLYCFLSEARNDLTICRMTECSASVAGGKEILLFCEKVTKDDIQVFKLSNKIECPFNRQGNIFVKNKIVSWLQFLFKIINLIFIPIHKRSITIFSFSIKIIKILKNNTSLAVFQFLIAVSNS